MGSNGEEIRRTITLTEHDVVAANLLWVRRFQLSRGALLCPALTGFLLTAICMTRSPAAYWITYAAGVGLLGALAVYLLSWAVNLVWIHAGARRAFRQTTGQRRPTDYAMGPEGLNYVQEDCSAKMAWHVLTRWAADERYLLLFNTRLTFYVLPRRDFSNAEVGRIEAWLEDAGVPRF